MESKILIIAGMHRSGTSVLSQWLYHCGLHLGERLLGPGIGNTEGHFEDLDFLELHQEILNSDYLQRFSNTTLPGQSPSNINLPQNNRFTTDSRASNSPAPGKYLDADTSLNARAGYVHGPVAMLSVYQKEKLRSVIGFKNSLQQQWGWKEPRTCLFLNHYKTLIPQAYFLIIIRNYRETVSSLIQRDLKELDKYYLSKSWISRQNWIKRKRNSRTKALYHAKAEFYLRVWIAYNEAILQAIEPLPAHQFIVTDHGQLTEQHTGIFDTLVNKWGFSLRAADFSQIYKKTLLSEVTDIDPFVMDKSLLQQAVNLEHKIRSYL